MRIVPVVVNAEVTGCRHSALDKSAITMHPRETSSVFHSRPHTGMDLMYRSGAQGVKVRGLTLLAVGVLGGCCYAGW